MITELTPEQEKLRDEVRQEWFDWGWCTDRADRPRAEQALGDMYEFAGYKRPEFHWCESPKAAREFIKEHTGESVNMSSFDGHIDSYWIAFYVFCRMIGVKYEEKYDRVLDMWVAYAQSAGPAFPYENVCVVVERPCVASYDENEVLHSEEGPALAYPDGSRIYCIHGVVVPEKCVTAPWDMTLEEIEGEENMEVRRIMQDRWCWNETDDEGRYRGEHSGRWLSETGAKTLDMDVYDAYENPETGEWVQVQRALLEDKENRRFLMCTDSSTDRVYYIRSGDEAMTCREAHKSFNGGIDDADIVVSS